MKVLLYTIFTLLFGLSCIAGCQAQEMTLVQNSQPNAQIVISANASPTEKYAAAELQRAILKISGTQLSLASTVSKSTFNIIIGTPQSVPEIKSANLFNTDNSEEVRNVTRGKVLFLAGKTSSAALFAVYTFLQDQLNCRWYWPGETGEYLPSQQTISIHNLDVRQTPSLSERSLSIDAPHWDEDTMIWMSRNRMNWHHLQGGTMSEEHIKDLHEKGMKAVLGGHNITLSPELLKEHPEYLAMYGGKRQFPPKVAPQLCWSNIGVQHAVAERIEGWWKKYPDADSISFLAADQTHFCECDQCKAMAPDVSTRWQKFCAAVIQLVNQQYPGKHYQALAYQAYRDVPTAVAPFNLISYTTYNINYTKPMTDPTNAKARDEILAWQKLGGHMGIRGYEFIPFNKAMYTPITPLIVQQIAWAHQVGLKGWKSEIFPYGRPYGFASKESREAQGSLQEHQNWATNRMAVYAVAQAMWNASIDPASITRDWAQHIFGPAAQPMLAYYVAMQQAWTNSSKPLTYFTQPPANFAPYFISDPLLQNARDDFAQARKDISAMQDTPACTRIAEQINLESAMLDNWRQVYLLQQGRAGRLQTYAVRAAQTPEVTANPNDPAWKSIQPLPTFVDSKYQPAADATKVLLQWDDNALYLRFICDDNDIAHLVTNGAAHDSNVFGDDSIEMFLDNPSISGHYFHVAINAKNQVYDASGDGAMNFDKSWDPAIASKTSVGANSWILDVKLPFNEFGITAKDGADWKMSFKRDGARRRANTGWPDASYHDPAGFGTVTLVEKAPAQKRVLIYDAGNTHKDALLTAFRKSGFTVRDVPLAEDDFKSTFAQGVDAITLFHPSGSDFALSDDTMINTVLPFIKKGGLVLISGYGNKPLEKWFGADAAAQWSGWSIDVNRKSTFVAPGNWQSAPNDLSKVLQNGVTPASAFTPLSEKWQVLGKLRMKDGSEKAYLMQLKIGEGKLVLTSSNFGYGGGFEMFGNQNPDNCAKLVENLLAQTRAQ